MFPTLSRTSSTRLKSCESPVQAVNLTPTPDRIKLLGEASTLNGKRYVNDAIGVVIERTGDKVTVFLRIGSDHSNGEDHAFLANSWSSYTWTL